MKEIVEILGNWEETLESWEEFCRARGGPGEVGGAPGRLEEVLHSWEELLGRSPGELALALSPTEIHRSVGALGATYVGFPEATNPCSYLEGLGF